MYIIRIHAKNNRGGINRNEPYYSLYILPSLFEVEMIKINVNFVENYNRSRAFRHH